MKSGYRTQSADTSEEAERILFDRLRRLEPWQRADLLRALNRSVRKLGLAGLRSRHPGADEAELRLRLAELYIGRDGVSLVREAGARDRRR